MGLAAMSILHSNPVSGSAIFFPSEATPEANLLAFGSFVCQTQSETCYTDEKGETMSPEALRQLLRKAGSHEREPLLRKLETNARQTFKVGGVHWYLRAKFHNNC